MMRRSSLLLSMLLLFGASVGAWGGSSGGVVAGGGEGGAGACSELSDSGKYCSENVLDASDMTTGTLPPMRLTAGAVTQFETDLEAVIELGDLQGNVALGSQTTGGYAGSSTEGGAADNGDSATGFFSIGQIEVAHGGTGASSLTNHGVLFGQGTSAVVASSAGTAGQPLVSGGASADPSFAALLPAALDFSADNTTANATTGHHGLLPKLDSSATKYLDGSGAWSIPAGVGIGGTLGSTANVIPTASGTGGATAQPSLLTGAPTDALATPALALTTDANTGISWIAGADKLSLVAGGIETLRVESNGDQHIRPNAVSPVPTIYNGDGSASSAARWELNQGGSDGLGGDVCFWGGNGRSCFIAGAFGYNRFDFVRYNGLTADTIVNIYDFADGTRSAGGFADSEYLSFYGVTGSYAAIEVVTTGSGAANKGLRLIPKGGGALQVAGHVETNGTAPSISSCGTSPGVAGNDGVMAVTIGSGVVTSCTVTFAKTWMIAPICVTSDTTNILTVKASATTTVLTLTSATTMGGDVVGVHCLGYY